MSDDKCEVEAQGAQEVEMQGAQEKSIASTGEEIINITSANDDDYINQENDLSSTSGGGSFSDLSELQVLDLHKNSLEKLTEDIGHLANLRVSIDLCLDGFLRVAAVLEFNGIIEVNQISTKAFQ